MDLVKIGKYIAAKRKAMGLTQKQLAEKLGMSDKSVSKWERGVCLPDVSVYLELCDILGISINEFLAGEDISVENLVQKSEDNLIEITKESRHRIKHLKGIVGALVVVAILITAMLGLFVVNYMGVPQSNIVAVESDSVEMKTAELLAGSNDASMFHYISKEPYHTLKIYLSEYRSGELVDKQEVCNLGSDMSDSPRDGMIVLVPDFTAGSMHLVVADDNAKYETTIPILADEADKLAFGRTTSQLEESVDIHYDIEQGLVTFSCGKDGVESISVAEAEHGEVSARNDYVYYVSVIFEK